MDKVIDDLELREQWGPFPELRIDESLDPFERQLVFGSATTHYLYEIALATSGTKTIGGWQERLKEVERIACVGLSASGKSLTEPFLFGFTISAAGQPALAFLEVCEEGVASTFPRGQLFGSLALWLLVDAYRFALKASIDRANQLEVQAAFAIAVALGEGGREVMADLERKRRGRSAEIGGNASHEAQNARKRELLEEFRKRNWASKAQAAAALAPKYCFSVETVRRWLRGEALKTCSDSD